MVFKKGDIGWSKGTKGVVKPNSGSFKKGQKSWNEGIKVLKMSGKKHFAWKGNKAGYRAIHIWVERNYGKPTTCEHCQTANLTGHQIHWASKVKIHTRNREDWLRLCSKCHGLYDKINKLRKHIK